MNSATENSDAAVELPKYADVAGDSSPNLFHSESPNRSEFKTGLQDGKGYAWLTLQVGSRSPSAASPPLFFEGDTITGVVHLDADKTDSVKVVYVEVLATTTAIGQEPEIFLTLKEVLWSHEKSTHAAPKLKSKHDWPFEFILPKGIEVVGPHGKRGLYQLPPSFSERASPAYLDYRIVVTIKRGALKADQILTTTIGYQPLTIPDSAPTSLRRLAYTEGSSIPGPKQDPKGWKVLEKRTIEGVIFGKRDAKIHVQLSLAKPVQYALGSPVPVHIMLESEDSQALDLLSSPTAMRVELIRIITMGSEATAENSERKPSPNYVATVASRAYFWNIHEPGEGQNCRILQGEVDLETTLKPTFVFPRLSIEYSINFEGFEVTGWHAKPHSHGAKGPLLEERVKITSRQIAGVSMQSVAPPGYQKPAINYGNAINYLMNGKERFIH